MIFARPDEPPISPPEFESLQTHDVPRVSKPATAHNLPIGIVKQVGLGKYRLVEASLGEWADMA